jgi:serine/threonine protein phosphatase 1
MPLYALTDKFSAQPARIPDGQRIYAIGDLHGRADLLRKLHALIRADMTEVRADQLPTKYLVIYLGDLFDRGNHVRDLIDMMLDDPLDGFVSVNLRGNHDQMVLDFLEDEQKGPDWVFNGGDATLRSYGADLEDPAFGREGWGWLQKEFREGFPVSHLSFVKSTAYSHVIGDYFFCHAGVRPGKGLSAQSPDDLMTIRRDFLDSDEDFEKIIVHGHTIVEEVQQHANRIAIDTGAWRTGKLSCLVLEQDKRHVIHT